MRVRVDRERCTGHGRCYALAPEVFEDDDAGYCVIPRAEVPPERADAVRSAARNCPESAITLEAE